MCVKCGRTGANRKTGVRAARGSSFDGQLCAVCYADEHGERNALLHFSEREIAMERRHRARAAEKGGNS